MPSIAAGSSSVLQRLTGKRHPDEITQAGTGGGVVRPGSSSSESPPSDALSEADRSRAHRRESSILSLTSSVTDLGHNVRRSVSLRSHRTQGSGSSSGHRHRLPPPGASPLTKAESVHPAGPLTEPPTTALPPPPRSRGKLSISGRSFSGRFNSTDNLSIFSSWDHHDTTDAPPLPPLEPSKSPFSMLVAHPAPKRAAPEPPTLAHQGSLVRDVSTSHSGSAHGSAPSTVAAPSAGNPSAIYQAIHETSAKRMATIDYFRKVLEGNIFYFNTLHFTPSELSSSIPSLHPSKLGRRATGYIFLGYSLPMLPDLHSDSALEYLKELSALLQEFETYQSLVGVEGSGGSLSRARVGQMFKTGMGLGTRTGIRGGGRRSSAATDSIALDTSKAGMLGFPSGADATSPLEAHSPIGTGHDFHHLLTPHLPFEPDFGMTFATLCDTLMDTYAHLLSLVSSPDVCSPAVGEAFTKADKAVRKILVANVMRELEDSTRQGAKTEVAGLGRLVLGGLM